MEVKLDLECSANNSTSMLAISKDILVEGQHFFSDTPAYSLGYKSLAVNLSDLAAMGAEPVGCLLGIALRDSNPVWLEQFSKGLFCLLDQYACPLVGGDTTRTSGPIMISITVLGRVQSNQALRRNAAQVGDDIWVSGKLGDAALALRYQLAQTDSDTCHRTPHINMSKISAEAVSVAQLKLNQPDPRVALGIALRNIAHAAIDISDGLAQDLGHILKASKVGARIEVKKIPMSHWLQQQSTELQHECALAGGDDYELCFSAPSEHRQTIESISKKLNLPLNRVGQITADNELQLIDAHHQKIKLTQLGYDHFNQSEPDTGR